MKKILPFLFLAAFLILPLIAQEQTAEEQPKIAWPEDVRVELEKLIKSNAPDNIFNVSLLRTFFLPARENKMYSVVFFSIQLDEDVSEINELIKQRYEAAMEAYKKEKKKKPKEEISEPPPLTFPQQYHHFYMYIYKVQGDKKEFYLQYNAPIPFNEEGTEFYSFGIPLEPGKYIFALEIIRTDHSKFGTSLIPIDVPSYSRLRKISFSEPLFIRNFKQTSEVETVFTIHRNSFQIGRILFFPYVTHKFKPNESPSLLLQIFGASVDLMNKTYDIDCRLSIRQGKEVITKFKRLSLNRPSLYQPIVFKKSETEFLDPGDYFLLIEIWDRLSNRRGKLEIPFTII